ncbi:hypothetical protein [Actinomadura violacea]|uniref:Uncharacterized protein n=1 Tax=Actinomadura violacea TaxID=2819934 RepID=A0ABS3S956_9ACTN|nr:hypothetical protein [Actinomadura violacea]MBO2465542.1 hypothetical protein [Actinomadura violacea]
MEYDATEKPAIEPVAKHIYDRQKGDPNASPLPHRGAEANKRASANSMGASRLAFPCTNAG